VGTYGFLFGGLIVERGRLPEEPFSPLEIRVEVPRPWRFVLLQPPAPGGLSGPIEQAAFARLPPVPTEVTAALIAEVRERLLPAVLGGDFAAFSDSLYEYGRLAGSCFARVQGGPFNGPRLAALVQRVRDQGVPGVGQSSWGPTLFALLPDEAQAQDFVARMAGDPEAADVRFAVAAPDNRGARIVCTG
jgi:beta-ribofuranosylaminobenzene 5'-phosphate synthase